MLLTIRVSKNGRPAAERATEALAALGITVLGVIVNGVGSKNSTATARAITAITTTIIIAITT